MIDRISGRGSFRRFRGARRIRSGPITVVVAEPLSGRPALAFAVPRRVGTAVVRNRIRRRLREAARDLDGRGALPVGSYLVVVHPAAAGCSSAELAAALHSAVGRA